MKRILLLITFTLYIALILFLSFQTGGDTADTSMGLTKFILNIFIQDDIPYEVLEHWHMTFRLLAHPMLFIIYSMFAMGVITEFVKKRWGCILLVTLCGILLAVVTEVGKWNILGRHFDVEEMWLNIAGVVGGVLVYLVAAKVFRLLRKSVVENQLCNEMIR